MPVLINTMGGQIASPAVDLIWIGTLMHAVLQNKKHSVALYVLQVTLFEISKWWEID